MKTISFISIFFWILILYGCKSNDNNNDTKDISYLEILGSLEDLPSGMTSDISVMATYSDGAKENITDDPRLEWKIADEKIAKLTIDKSSSIAEFKALIPGITTIEVKISNLSTSRDVVITDAIATSLDVISDDTTNIPIGFRSHLTLLAKFSDGTVRDVTSSSEFTWTSSDDNIIMVSNSNQPERGIVSAINEGTSDIMVTGMGLSSSISVHATSAKLINVETISIDGVIVSQPLGIPLNLDVIFKFDDDTTLNGESSSTPLVWSALVGEDLLKFDNINNTVVGEKTGYSIVSLSFYGSQDTLRRFDLYITDAVPTAISLTSEHAKIPLGHTTDIKAELIMSDGNISPITESSEISWASSDDEIIAIESTSGRGTALGKRFGYTTISASGYGLSKELPLEVVSNSIDSLVITSEKPIITIGEDAGLTATAIFSEGIVINITNNEMYSWSSNNSDVIEVNNSNIKALSEGISTVEVKSPNGESGSITLRSSSGIYLPGRGLFSYHTRFSRPSTAESICANNDLDGKSNWRVPTSVELQELYDKYPGGSIFDFQTWPDEGTIAFWSKDEDTYTFLNFYTGVTYPDDGLYVLTVCISPD